LLAEDLFDGTSERKGFWGDERHGDRQSGVLQPLVQNAFDGRITRIVEAQGTGTGGFEALGRVFALETHQTPRSGQTLQNGIFQQPLDQGESGFSDGAGRLRAAFPCLQETGEFVLGEVVRMGKAFSRLLGTLVGGEELVILVVDPHLRHAPTYPEFLAHEAKGSGVVGVVENEIVVAVEAGLLHDCHIVGSLREGEQPLALGLPKAVERAFLGSAVKSFSGFSQTPEACCGIDSREIGPLSPCPETALDIGNASLDFAFVLRSAGSAGSDAKTVVLGAFYVGAIGDGIVYGGVDDGGFEVVADDPLGYGCEEGEGVDMQFQPGFDPLVGDKLQILVSAPGEGHDKGVDFLAFAVFLGQASDLSEIDLCLFAGLCFDADTGVGSFGFEYLDEAINGGVRPLVTAFFETAENGVHGDIFAPEFDNDLTEWFDGGGVLWGQRVCESLLSARL